MGCDSGAVGRTAMRRAVDKVGNVSRSAISGQEMIDLSNSIPEQYTFVIINRICFSLCYPQIISAYSNNLDICVFIMYPATLLIKSNCF